MDGLWWKTLLKWMIWGYQNFLEHPYIATTSEPHQPGDSIRDQTWSPNVGLLTIRHFKRVMYNHSKKGTSRIARDGFLSYSFSQDTWKI